ncbi:MAG: 4-hydroxyphenylacetate 3-hydroxylase family protein [Actinobacteria bacterium]|nr:4-hydroxyphenylacetate 3-hydroxylase family protein [Actinomycetota bacterium]
MMTGNEYIESLRRLEPRVYAFGCRIENVVDHPLFAPHIASAAMTYGLAHTPKYHGLMTVTSHLTGKTINRFTHIHQSTGDLITKVKMLRALARLTGSCFQRCVGLDALNALYTLTYEMDAEGGSIYHERLKKYLLYVQENDLMCAGSMTDPKGDRSLRPYQQADPDLYLHVVDRRKDGIVIRGAKAHQTGVINSHEMIIMPTVALGPEDQDYAVACAVPTDAPGITHIFGRQTNDTRRLQGDEIDTGNPCYGLVGGEALSVFEDVFVPWERVFMCGEYRFAGSLVERFASYHRQNYGGCKAGVSDIIIGATSAMARYNGVAGASHVKDKVVEMVHLTETLYCGSLACSCEGKPTPSGAYMVDPLLANTVKQNITRFIYEVGRISHDIAGGFVATLPSEKDFSSSEVGHLLEKYFKGVAQVPTAYRVKMARLIENLTGGTSLLESMHGAGSPQAQRIMILRQANLAEKEKLARRLARIPED